MSDYQQHKQEAAAAYSSATGEAQAQALREKLAEGRRQGKTFWRTFEELANTPEFEKWIEDEFPNRQSMFQMDRRRFLTLSGAAMAMAGMTGCRFLGDQKAVPYVRAPEEIVPGKPLLFASTMLRGGYGLGVLVESFMGRPIKIEGNPQHPASLGATDSTTQGELLMLYDPDRSQSVVFQGEMSSWDAFVEALRQNLRETGGAGLRVLTETVTSPTMADQIGRLLDRYPDARWHQYEPVNRGNVHAGTNLAFGRPVNPIYRLDRARVVVSLDADFLLTMPGSVRYARDFISGRKVRKNRTTMNRLYVVESDYSVTGAKSDHRLPVRPSDVEAFARILHTLVMAGDDETGISQDNLPASVSMEWVGALVRDLRANSGAAVIVPGEDQTPVVHALAHAMNSRLGAVGQTVVYTTPVEENTNSQFDSLRNLTGDMQAGRVRTLLILGGNPVYTAPADLGFAAAMDRVPLRIHLGLYADETAALCHWHIPEAHPLEAWGDARAFDGTASIVQPLIAPLYGGKSAYEVMAEFLDEPRPGFDIVRDFWARERGTTGVNAGPAFEQWWETTLHNGVVANSAAPVVTDVTAAVDPAALPAPAAGGEGLQIVFKEDPYLRDGRHANNPWLQELPKPLTTITWDNVAIIAPATARRLNIVHYGGGGEPTDAVNIAQVSGKQVVRLDYRGRRLSMPVWIMPGQPADTVTVHLGYGRTRVGHVGNGVGFNTYLLRTSDAPNFGTGLTVTPTGDEYEVAYTQPHHLMKSEFEEANRDIVRVATLAEYTANGGIVGPPHLDAAGGGGHGAAAGHAPAATGELAEESAFGNTERTPDIGEPANQIGTSGEHTSKAENPANTNPEEVSTQPTQGREYPADPYRKEWEYIEEESKEHAGHPSLYPNFSNKDFNAWAMSIDLTACIGCNACNIACMAENNIPCVGKEQVAMGREMHWIRVDHYYQGEDLDNPQSHFMPVPCMHCEKAPCEPVCPVAATIHSHEGLNQMIYNRCIGTRYCSNNCPYKVRRFNFLKWTAGKGNNNVFNYDLPVMKLSANPDVSIRGRGVMEKCTYCVQRINAKRIEAKKEYREIKDLELQTACMQVCPTRAIIFGDRNNPNALVTKLQAEPHDYVILGELNTRPRTSYLAEIKNPNPEIEALAAGVGAGTGTAASTPAAVGH